MEDTQFNAAHLKEMFSKDLTGFQQPGTPLQDAETDEIMVPSTPAI
jgi:hypothetical protein